MKKFLLLCALALGLTMATHAQLLISENFDYPSGNLDGKGAPGTVWTTSGESVRIQVTSLANNTGALVYTGYSSKHSYITLQDNSSGDDPYKPFIGNQSVPTNAASTFYLSFVVNVPNASATDATSSANHVLALRTNASDEDQRNLCYFYIGNSVVSGNTRVRFGINKDDNADGIYAPGAFSFNTTYLIVIRYDIVTGSNNDRIFMWVNPTLASQPATSGYTPSSNFASVTSGFDGGSSSGNDEAYSGNINALQLFQRGTGAGVKMDLILASYATGLSTQAANASAAWADLTGQNTALPVHLKSFTADRKNSSAVSLKWVTASEQNNKGFYVQRSTGSEWKNVAFVFSAADAGNSSSDLSYEFTDQNSEKGISQYRIQQVDMDAKATYSNILAVRGEGAASRVSVYPNPSKGKVNVVFENKASVRDVLVSDIQGKLIDQRRGITANVLVIEGLKPGLFTVKVIDRNSGVSTIEKVVVQ